MNAMRGRLEPIITEIKSLLHTLQKQPRFKWAVVTGTSPLQIQLEGDTEPLSGVPARTIALPASGDRVYCVLQNGRCTIIGRAGG